MSQFREVFDSVFGCDYPGHAIEMALPRLRFELAHGSPEQSMELALQRCKALFEFITQKDDEIWIELISWPCEGGTPVVTFLQEHGLCLKSGSTWNLNEITVEEDGDSYFYHRHSAALPSRLESIPSLLEATLWNDHGGWRGWDFKTLIVAPKAKLGFWPYDDRGADVFAPSADLLLGLYKKHEAWILDYDKKRILSELGLD